MGWEALFSGTEEKALLNIINSIALRLEKNKPNHISPGLFSGSCGISLFWYYFYLYERTPKHKENYLKLFQHSIDTLSRDPLGSSFSVGINGILWTLFNYESLGAVKTNFPNGFIDQIDPFLIQQSKYDLKRGNYDYFNGGNSSILHLLYRINDSRVKISLEEITQELLSISHKTNQGISWPFTKSISNLEFNLGLAHGIPSIIIILSKILYSKICPKQIFPILESSIKWVLAQKNSMDSPSLFSNFASLGKNTGNYSRLAWCYGDLGIAVALLFAANATKNIAWQEEGIKIALHASKRRDVKMNDVKDSCLCHGTAGVAHVFNRLFQQTNIEQFKEASRYWHLQTLTFYYSSIGLKTRRFNTATQSEEWVNDDGFLEGISGIGLSLLASINNIEPKWDESLLLS